MSRTIRPAMWLAAVGLFGALVACNPSEELPPTPTKTPAPFVPAEAAEAPTPAPFHTPTPENAIAVGPDSYPSDTNPLTGLTVSDPAVLDRRPLVVVVSNSPPVDTRPQAGLNAADIVYEHYTEGGVTRYAALFWSDAPELVGSVRSCRLLMLEMTLMYDALWACSGSSVGVGEQLLQSPNLRLLINGQYYGEPYLRRVFDESIAVVPAAPHNLFAVPSAIWDWADEKGHNLRPDLGGLAFNTVPPEGGAVATRVTVDYRGAGFRPVWEYDAASGKYLRFDEGQPYIDNLTGDQLAFDNVVIVGAQEVITDIVEDASGALALEQQVWGEGPLTVFRDGLRYEGTWRRATRDDMITLHDLNGNALALRPGNSWYQVVPLGFDRLTVEP